MSMLDQAIEQLKQRQQLLAILLFSLVAVMVWIGIGLVSSQQSTAITPDLRAKALSLTPTINSQVLQQIQQEPYFNDQELQNFPMYRVIDGNNKKVASPSSSTINNSSSSNPPTPPIDLEANNPENLPETESPIVASESGSL